jgi:glycosyltransferase involved in cell wall biosynthesis
VYLGYSSVALRYFQRMGYSSDKCFRAVNCVDTDAVFATIASRGTQAAALRQELNLENRRVILFVGALMDHKRLDRLLRAFARIKRSISDARLLIVGDGNDLDNLKKLSRELRIDSDVIFAGSVIDGVSDYFELADIFVMPGLGGLAVSEALAHGLPVICSLGDGCEVDLVRNGETGFRIETDSDEEVTDFIVEKITWLFQHPQQLEAMQRQAKQLIVEEHNVNSYIANIVDALQFAVTHRRNLPLPKIPSEA